MKREIFLILHNIRSLYNVGAIFRTADAAGVSKIFLTGYTPLPAAKTALALDSRQKHLGIVATLRSWKGHLFLLDAFARLDRPDLHLLIVGEGPMRAPIEEKIAALGIGSRVTLSGQRSDPEHWLQAMDVFCLPSYANEGVPQAILQAMLCGLPIVTTPVGAILEAVSDRKTALIVPPRDAAMSPIAVAPRTPASAPCAASPGSCCST